MDLKPARDPGARLHELFEVRRQLIIYHFMFDPSWDQGCEGCSLFADNIPHLAHLHARDTSLALVSRAPQEKLERYRKRMGWNVPWYSSLGSDFNADLGLTTDEGETFGLSVFLRDGERVFRTYFTDGRRVEALGSVWTLPRPDAAGPAGGLGRLAKGVAADATVYVVASP